MTLEKALDKMEQHFGSLAAWRGAMDGSYALGSYYFGALIEPRKGKYRVVIGANLGWGQERDTIAQAEFDTLEEAADFGMLIYTQNKPEVVDRTRFRSLADI